MRDSASAILTERVTARVEAEEFIVFAIGMRINRPWKVHRWVPVVAAMRRMIEELHQLPQSGLRHVESWFGRTTIMLQYWDSFEALSRYATARDLAHLPAWGQFNKAVGSNGDVGIWHETYRVRPGDFECVYHNMPRFGLSRAFETVPARGELTRAAGRMAARGADQEAAPVAQGQPTR